MWRRRQSNPDRETETESEDVRRAREAAEAAISERRRIEAQAPAAEAIGATLRDAISRNHFGEQIDAAFRRRSATP
jgi:hypothetical protein